MKRIALAVVLSLVTLSPVLAQTSTDAGQTQKKHHSKKHKSSKTTAQPAQ